MKAYTYALNTKERNAHMSVLTELILAVRKERKSSSKLHDRASIEMRVRKREHDFFLNGRNPYSDNTQTIG